MSQEDWVDLTLDMDGLAEVDDLADKLKYLGGEQRANAEFGMTAFVAAVLEEEYGGDWDRDAQTLTVSEAGSWNVGGWVAKRLHYGRADILVAKARQDSIADRRAPFVRRLESLRQERG